MLLIYISMRVLFYARWRLTFAALPAASMPVRRHVYSRPALRLCCLPRCFYEWLVAGSVAGFVAYLYTDCIYLEKDRSCQQRL
ncbi:Uncharacterized protein HZ326_26015 [Fusarium oxysporum f. sp. albedinis]|nr:Uncharacterized protein HZ326_26015 [Fusarium oxysporum f. sp. albedinis]